MACGQQNRLETLDRIDPLPAVRLTKGANRHLCRKPHLVAVSGFFIFARLWPGRIAAALPARSNGRHVQSGRFNLQCDPALIFTHA